jgi:multidrug efflux pump subunit AcrA (membrane-fusion protein)
MIRHSLAAGLVAALLLLPVYVAHGWSETPPPGIRTDMTPTVTIEVERRDGVLQVPESALRFVPFTEVFAQLRDHPPDNLRTIALAQKRAGETGHGYVWVVDGGPLVPVQVTIGISDGVHSEVASNALRPGVAVVTGVTLKL